MSGNSDCHEVETPPASDRPLSARHLPALDGVRGIAILAVMCIHFSWLPKQTAFDRALTAVTNCGWMGVDLFFVLSGFLITGILIDAKDTPTFFRSFYARRALRILPLYYAFVVAFVVLLPIGHKETPQLRDLLAHQGWLWAHAVNIWAARDGLARLPYDVGIAWSLSLEEQFYLVWPFIVACTSRVTLRRVCVACIAGAFLLRLFIAGRWPSAVYTLMPTRMDALALGGLIAVVAREPNGMHRLRRYAMPVGAVASSVIVIMYVIRGNMREADFGLDTLGFAGADWLSAAVVMLGLTTAPRLLTRRPLTFIGQRSYALYLFHLPVAHMLQGVETRLLARPLLGGSPILWMTAWMVLAMGATMALSQVTWVCLERPMLNLKRFFPYERVASARAAALPNIPARQDESARPAWAG